ncbi:p60 domain containing protein [Ophiostoma piceae UAMH 11346]|uniref:Ribosome biogenesis protein NOP53 n=1 Tax=Ophiostoma piceae (strain UAMH 11346) TaxID=1262450 RepID=S3DB26_OPHP1|nr:p60 domain containing protein [Ophiostoma piceae UAMH 11346]
MPVIGAKSGSVAGPSQHKQPSRKGRKAWRKNVDVSEVEKGLEERNDQIIKGGLVKEQESDQLFQVEDTGDLEVAKKLSKKFTKGLKADEILAQRSAVPAVSARKRKGEGKTTDGVLETKRVRKDYISHKELVRLRQMADGHHESTVEVNDASFDPWAVTDTSVVLSNSERSFSFLPKPRAPKAPVTMAHAPISLAANGKPIPAVAKPKADMSYNPSFEAYEARLTEEGAKAVEAERKRLAGEEAERVRMEGVARSAAEADAAAERELLSEWEEDSAWEGFQSGLENEEVTTAKRPKRKTPAQRNKINRRKEAEAKKRHDAIAEHKKEQTKHLAKLLAEDKFKHEQALALAAAESSSGESDDEEGDDNVLRRRQLGKFHLPERDLELVLPDELQGSLRLLKPEGNLLQDRYRSMVVRGKVEARKRRPFRKQPKVKITEKWAHKDFQLF